eukprot:CAMPEP_0115648174 /NCGR_PEP_ID=MMETSP0272-20121206/39836_1 /TAXON_ID=71861 /ORGANISM="Scrippsiella trochoidea, Strain CCMP3099" /LENGTH=101 /DNA_ID=CAMNT_0003085777 /DNA_START=1152 /DNA_END=1454 /DNA_ORIENTATION=+
MSSACLRTTSSLTRATILYDRSKQLQSPQVLKDVARFVGHQEKMQGLHGLAHIPRCFRLDEGVVAANVHQAVEGGEKAIHSQAGHLNKLAGEQRLPRGHDC